MLATMGRASTESQFGYLKEPESLSWIVGSLVRIVVVHRHSKPCHGFPEWAQVCRTIQSSAR